MLISVLSFFQKNLLIVLQVLLLKACKFLHSQYKTNLNFCIYIFSNCLLGKTDADREGRGGEEDDIEDTLIGRLKQHRGDVNWMGRG